MSIDTNFYFNPQRFSNSQTIDFAQRMIVEVFGAQRMSDFKVEFIDNCRGDYATISFDGGGKGDGLRQLNIHFSVEFGGFRATMFCLYADPKAQVFMEACAREIGGFYIANDSDGVIEEFQAHMEGNEHFLLRQIELGIDVENNKEKLIHMLKER